jgi:uncharacterized membrane protein
MKLHEARFSWMQVVAAISMLAYPFIILFGLVYFEPRYVGLGLLVVLLIRIRTTLQHLFSAFPRPYLFIMLGLGLLLCSVLVSNDPLLLRLYPAAMNAGVWLLFTLSLRYPPSMVEIFARMQQPDLPLQAVAYTRNVTRVWSVFLLLNTCFSLYTALYASKAFWAWYNGFFTYLAMGALFAGEWLFRRYWLQRAG